jgi:hypothetical protein
MARSTASWLAACGWRQPQAPIGEHLLLRSDRYSEEKWIAAGQRPSGNGAVRWKGSEKHVADGFQLLVVP